ncbi:MAG: hypothetical protein ACXWYM_00210 [Candidatus Binatia bacterium]
MADYKRFSDIFEQAATYKELNTLGAKHAAELKVFEATDRATYLSIRAKFSYLRAMFTGVLPYQVGGKVMHAHPIHGNVNGRMD